jgi:hypothetical protein
MPVLGQTMPPQLQEQEATALGWGVLTFHSPMRSCELRQVQLPIIPHWQCLVKSKYTPQMLPFTLFCAGLPQGGKDPCQAS